MYVVNPVALLCAMTSTMSLKTERCARTCGESHYARVKHLRSKHETFQWLSALWNVSSRPEGTALSCFELIKQSILDIWPRDAKPLIWDQQGLKPIRKSHHNNCILLISDRLQLWTTGPTTFSCEKTGNWKRHRCRFFLVWIVPRWFWLVIGLHQFHMLKSSQSIITSK